MTGLYEEQPLFSKATLKRTLDLLNSEFKLTLTAKDKETFANEIVPKSETENALVRSQDINKLKLADIIVHNIVNQEANTLNV